MRTCERCKLPLIDDRAGYSNDGRLICTRVECQNVERLNRAVDDGRIVLVTTEQFATVTPEPHLSLELELEIRSVLVRPTHDEDRSVQ